jgi:hypothetical protein
MASVLNLSLMERCPADVRWRGGGTARGHAVTARRRRLNWAASVKPQRAATVLTGCARWVGVVVADGERPAASRHGSVDVWPGVDRRV